MQKFLTILFRANATYLPEHPRKVLLSFESTGHRNIQHTHVSCTQDFLRVLNPTPQDKLVWRLPVDLRNI